MIDRLTERVRELTGRVEPFGFDLKIDLDADGVIHIASTEAPVDVSNEDKPAAATLKVAAGDLDGILNGTENPTTAFMLGKIQVDGDLGKIMALVNALKATGG